MQLRQLPPQQLPVVVYTAAASIDATIAVALVAGRLEGDELRDSDPVVQPRFAVVVALATVVPVAAGHGPAVTAQVVLER